MKGFSVFAAIKHLNIRKQGEEQEVLAIDVKLEARVDAWTVDDLMCAGLNEGACANTFWLSSEDQAPSFPQLSEIGFDREYKNLKVDVLGLELKDAAIKKFRFKAVKGGIAELVFQMSIAEPPPKTVDLLASQLATQTWFKFIVVQGDLPLHDAGKSEPSAEPKSGGDADTEADPLYAQAVEMVLETGKASVSWVQRRLSVGYNRAARMVEQMEVAGIVGPSGPGGEREIFKQAVSA